MALIYVHAFAARTELKAERAVRPRTSRSQRRRRRRSNRRDSRRRHRRRARLRSRYTRNAIAAVRTQGVSTLIPGPAVVGAQNTLVIVFADLRRGIKSITGTARQKSRACVASDRVVTSLRRQTVVLLQWKILKSTAKSSVLR